MKIWTFDECLNHVLISEGGYSDDANDSGGATKYGITHHDLSVYRGRIVTKDDVKNMTLEEAKLIYKKFYWDKMKLDLIKPDVRVLLLFDQGVNRGTSTAIKQAQIVLKNNITPIDIDGMNGILTSAAINSCELNEFCKKYLFASITAYINICLKKPTQMVFLKGWINRVFKLVDACFL